MALDQPRRARGVLAQAREAREKARAVVASDREVELVAEEAADRTDDDQVRQREVAAIRRESREQQNRLAFEQRAQHRDRVAVLGNQTNEIVPHRGAAALG